MQEPDRTLQAGRRYVLSESDEFYGIWDREAPGKPVESFAPTDEGLREATRRYARLTRQNFWAVFGPKALRWCLFGGLGLWTLTGLVLWIRNAVVSYPIEFPTFPGTAPLSLDPSSYAVYFEPAWVRLTRVFEIAAFRIWIAAVAILVAFGLFDRGRQPA